MITKNSVVLYKKQPAVVTDIESDKYVIRYCSVPASPTGRPAQYATQKVREKDILPLHPGPVSSLEKLLSFSDDDIAGQLSEAYELLISDEETASASYTFQELAGIVRGDFSADESWLLYSVLAEGFEFSVDETARKNGVLSFIPRSRTAVAELRRKTFEKDHADEVRAAFLKRLKQKKLELPDDAKYMVDVEALALGKTDKSKTLHDAGIAETPEKAHKLLLDTGIWDITRNPYPVRGGLSMQSASEYLPSPPDEDRIEVPGVSYAIDNEWSADPDDAVAWDGEYLWVHIADPASTVMPDSLIDKAARARGATLYIPEGASRMLCEGSLADYALGLNEKSRALSFRIRLAEDGAVTDCSVLKTIVDVKRLTYTQADQMKETAELSGLYRIARRNIARRNKAGAVSIDLPEVHITVDPETKKVSIGAVSHPESGDMVREMMLLAGEGAAHFAFKNRLPFPYISQEAPEIPADIPDGIAGEFRKVRCMRRRNIGITPAVHSGLGIGMYTQVTSPLRRYSDLVAHEQLRAFIDGRPLIDKDVMLKRISAGDEAMRAGRKAERNSNMHWTLVYLLQNPDWTGEAVCIEQRGNQAVFIIPSLGQQTLLTPDRSVALNDVITVRAGAVTIPELSVAFRQV
jgi:exoribonuclease-2